MAGWMRFLLGGILGALLGFFLSRSRRGAVSDRPLRATEDLASSSVDRAAPSVAGRPPVPIEVVPLHEAAWPGEPAAAQAEKRDEPAGLSLEPVDTLLVTGWEPDAFWPSSSDVAVGEPITEVPSEHADEESVVSEPPVVEALAAPWSGEVTDRSVMSIEELRARIEESRRRIRQELEEPFAITPEAPEAGLVQPPATLPTVPLDLEEGPVVAPAPAPLELSALFPSQEIKPGHSSGPETEAGFLEDLSSVHQTPSVDETFFADSGVRIDREVSTAGATDDLRSRIETARHASEDVFRPSPAELETSLTYDAMRARIEETRDRLKVKARDMRVPEGDAADNEADLNARIDRILSETDD